MGERGLTAPEILGKFSRGGKKAVRWAASKAGVSREAARLLWASPACVQETVANGLGMSRGCGQGVFGGEEETSRKDSEVDTIMDGIEDLERAWGGGVWAVENPRDSDLRNYDRIVTEWTEARG